MNQTMFISPSKYVQGVGVIEDLAVHMKNLGDKALFIADKAVLSLIGEKVKQSLEGGHIEVRGTEFNGECSYQEIERITKEAESANANVIIGAGGGKALDTAKVVSRNRKTPVALIPTIAATDAPTSSIAVIYGEDHSHEGFIQLEKNPDSILVDTEIIARAPVRFLVAGMGDALGTKFEAEACSQFMGKNIPGYRPTLAALALSQSCYDILIEHGLRAKWSAEKKLVTPSLEKIIEANILLSGLGFESGGLAAAHAVQVGFTFSQKALETYHGEKVALGVLVQLFMEEKPEADILEVGKFCMSVGLPLTLDDLFVREVEVPKVSEEACKASVMKNMPFPVTPKLVADSILLADSYGKTLKQQ